MSVLWECPKLDAHGPHQTVAYGQTRRSRRMRQCGMTCRTLPALSSLEYDELASIGLAAFIWERGRDTGCGAPVRLWLWICCR